MSSNNVKDSEIQAYKDDSRIPCKYGTKCYQKNPQHHSKYKHPPKGEMVTYNLQLTTNMANLQLITLINITIQQLLILSFN